MNSNLPHQSGLWILASYFISMSCADSTSRQWNNLQFLHEIKYLLFIFKSVLFAKYLWWQFELWPSCLWQKINLRKWKKTIIIFLSNRRLSYQNEVGRLLYPLPSADWPRYQEPDVSKSYTTRWHRPKLRYPWPVQCYRTGTVTLMDILHPSNDLPTGRDIPLEPFRRYEGNSSLSLWTIPFVV